MKANIRQALDSGLSSKQDIQEYMARKNREKRSQIKFKKGGMQIERIFMKDEN